MAEADRVTVDRIAAALHADRAERASEELIRALEPIIRAAISRVVPFDDVDDVAQEALIRLTYRFARWEPRRGTFSRWASAVARNLAIDYARRQDRAEVVLGERTDDIADQGSIDAIAAIDDASLVEWLFDHLRRNRDTQAQKVLTAIRDQAYSGQPTTHAAVAARAHVSVSTVRRAVIRIRASIEDQEGT
jgi:RNA polymerase sigma factor (sigma-70 family)